MNKLKSSVLALLFAAPLYLGAAPIAEVVSESPDGATYLRGGSFEVSAGMSLMAGDRIVAGDSTVVISFGNGSLLTLYPGSSIELTGATAGTIDLELLQGEILADASAVSTFTVATKAGSLSASGGVFGVLQSPGAGDDWTLQVRNLDAEVAFQGDVSLDSGDLTVSLIEPGKTVPVPAGEEVIVRGVYSESEEVFTLTDDGGSLAVIDSGTVAQLREASEQMSSAEVPGTGTTAAGPAPTEGTVIIEIPFQDVETASDKG
jgi:hypothetical protein